MTLLHTTGRALWRANPRNFSYDVLIRDREAFACAIEEHVTTHEFSPMTGSDFGGAARQEYDRRHTALRAYLASHDVDPELRELIDSMEDKTYDFACEAWSQGMQFASVVEQFRQGLESMVKSNGAQDQ